MERMWIVEESEVGNPSDENWTSGLNQEKAHRRDCLHWIFGEMQEINCKETKYDVNRRCKE
jgi:hypothetical protein